MSSLKIFLSSLIACGCTTLSALDLILSGSPSMTINQMELEAGAGSDFKESIESQEALLQVSISPEDGATSWRLKLSADAQQLPEAVRLYARMNNPSGATSGLDSVASEWVLIGYTPQVIATGTNYTGPFEIQLRIDQLHLKDLHQFQMTTRLSFELEQL